MVHMPEQPKIQTQPLVQLLQQVREHNELQLAGKLDSEEPAVEEAAPKPSTSEVIFCFVMNLAQRRGSQRGERTYGPVSQAGCVQKL